MNKLTFVGGLDEEKMAIRNLDPKISPNDKRLLKLLGKILTERESCSGYHSNVMENEVTLSDQDAEKLIRLLEAFTDSKEFRTTSYFVESMTSPTIRDSNSVRETFLYSREERGRSRVMSSTHWFDFRQRLGIAMPENPLVAANPMPFAHFMAMEERLLQQCGLSPNVVRLILTMVERKFEEIENMRQGKNPMQSGDMRSIVKKLERDIFDTRKTLSTIISSTILIGSDIGVIFTTRDWSVAGVISCISSAAIAPVLR